MRRFAIVGHRARTSGDFSLNDLPGGAGRMDVLCRCVNTAFFLSHDLRKDVECYLVLLGDPAPPKTVRFSGVHLRSLNPDERSAAALLKKALALPCGDEFRESSPGVAVRQGGLARLIEDMPLALLHEEGDDLRNVHPLPSGYLLSDHLNFTPEEEAVVQDMPRISVGPVSLHADHAITVVQNELDRRQHGWN
ncbi:MAG: tRNA (pseudouridine(54)-N(1))-methyltransferase TrmY [Methanomicrobiales archaeon]|nr:tRNA (pseudouridine(54)-N(1))-methyltransferase TrmY [Methanomicrobiales archaeon]